MLRANHGLFRCGKTPGLPPGTFRPFSVVGSPIVAEPTLLRSPRLIVAESLLGGSAIGVPAIFDVRSEYLFYSTGADQSVVVPSGKTSCTARLLGASGGGGAYSTGHWSGAGGYTEVVFPVSPGDTITVKVGSGGQGGRAPGAGSPKGGNGGWPNGGSGSYGDTGGGGGGGRSQVEKNGTIIAIAGGGGGNAGYAESAGAGGGSSGQAATGGGGTQVAGGTNAGNRQNGSAFQGGNADNGNQTTSTGNDDGGGGDGYFGGASGLGDGRSGGGGSGYFNAGVVTLGATYVGSNQTRPAQTPSTMAGVSTTGYGGGVASTSSSVAAPNGQSGLVEISFT